ncbi:hypothetical protein [Haliangium sp.]|uniref:hypothetical protein n=1 Tax=Haliangium sp. TaxID=2663208 RepID=UPI003D0965E2
MRTLLIATLCALVCAGLGPGCDCRGRRAGEDAGAAELVRTERVEVPAATSVPPLQLDQPRVGPVRLLAAGAAPRRVFRYRPGTGTQHLYIEADLEGREHPGRDAGWSPRVRLPALTYGLALTPGSAGEPMSVRGLDFEVGPDRAGTGPAATEPGRDAAGPDAPTAVAGRMAAAMQARYAAQVQGRRASAVIAERGLLERLVADPAAAPAPGPDTHIEMQQILVQSLVPLPEQPIGVGARWHVSMLVQRGAAVVEHNGVYELIAIEGSAEAAPAELRLRVRAELSQDGEPQRASAQGLPAGVRAELVALTWRAHGELVLSPAAFTPSAGELAVDYLVHSRLIQGARQREVLLESTGTVRLRTAVSP